MATTVRMRDEDKRILDALQARFTLGTGTRVPLDEVLHRVLEFVEGHEDDIIVPDAGPGLGSRERKAFFAGSSPWSEATREEDIDELLYGADSPP